MASELERLTVGHINLERLRYSMGPAIERDMVWLVPGGFLGGVHHAYGLPVEHVDGLSDPYLAHTIPPFSLDETYRRWGIRG